MLINEVLGIDGDEDGSLFDVIILSPFLEPIGDFLKETEEYLINETDHGLVPVRECITSSKRKHLLKELNDVKLLFPLILREHEFYKLTLRLINFLR